jgi:putative flavoprotein involved in K+ transport
MPASAETAQVIVVGAGPAGLAAAATLRRASVAVIVLERSPAIAWAWRGRYDRLRLNTSRLTSRLGATRYPRRTALFPSRDEFVAYLERYAGRERIDVRLGTAVRRIDRDGRGWTLDTTAGDQPAEHVVIATGYANAPFIPAWTGRDRFAGQLIHAADYRHAEPFRGRDVLVVGAGCSGMEIAHDLAAGGAARVRLAVRTPPNILLRSLAGVPGDLPAVVMLRLPPGVADRRARMVRRLTIGDLRPFGLPIPDEGPFARLARTGDSPAIVDREVIQAVKDRRIEVVADVDSLDASGVALADGTRIDPEAIVAATGYRCGLEPLVGHLGVLDERGVPRAVGGREAAAGLRFLGYVPQPGQIRRFTLEARLAARAIAAATSLKP